jgi:cbb3-type cytochrome oxidase subunit 3
MIPAMSEMLHERETSPRGGRLLWSLPLLLFAVLMTGILYEAGRRARNDRAAHERYRDQAADIVERVACTCILEREGGSFRHILMIFAPRSWQELWHRATRNECLAEAYTLIVTERGIQAVRPRQLPRGDGGFSP